MMSREGALYGTIGSPDEIWADYTEEALEGTPANEFENVEPPPPPADVAAAATQGATETPTTATTATQTATPYAAAPPVATTP